MHIRITLRFDDGSSFNGAFHHIMQYTASGEGFGHDHVWHVNAVSEEILYVSGCAT